MINLVSIYILLKLSFTSSVQATFSLLGNFRYINEAYGGFPAFLYLWDALLIFVLVHTTSAIIRIEFIHLTL